VVEDDHKVASFIQTGLGQEGYAVDVLREGTAAGAHARAVDYDAVVLDLMLPCRSGFDVLRARQGCRQANAGSDRRARPPQADPPIRTPGSHATRLAHAYVAARNRPPSAFSTSSTTARYLRTGGMANS
jgi:CheY-like chemotaxis protein